MTKYLKRYNEVMKLYRNGAFGQSHLTMHDILSQAGEDGLLNKMCLSEIASLRDSSKGMSKHLFHLLWANRKSSIANIAKLEKELEGFNLQQYCDIANISIHVLAKNAHLSEPPPELLNLENWWISLKLQILILIPGWSSIPKECLPMMPCLLGYR